MKVLLKSGDDCALLYWIKRSQRNDKVVGWFGGTSLLHHLDLPDTSWIDIHFTYPADGNLHYSLKYKLPSGAESFVTVYHDKIKRKIVDAAQGIREQTEELRGQPDDAFAHLMPKYRPPPLEDYASQSLFFQFPTVGLQVTNGSVFLGPSERRPFSCIDVGQDDLVVDAELLGTGSLNIGCFLYGREYSERWNGTLVLFKRDAANLPWIETSALFIGSV